MKKQRVWFDEVAHKKAGYGLPDPTRWKESAGEYKKAAQALARGNLGQAVDHLERPLAGRDPAGPAATPAYLRQWLDRHHRGEQSPVPR